jgi:Tfp pilus assembly protein PilO
MIKLIEKIKNINLVEKFSLDSKKVVLILIMSALFLYLDMNFLLKAQMNWIKQSSDGITKLNNDIKALDLGLKNMQEIKSLQKNTLPKKAKKIIFDSQLPSLLHDISKIGNANNVKILQIKPSRDISKAAAALKFSPLLISLDLQCGYHNLGKFINDLENSQTFISVESFKIEAQPEEPLRQRVSLILKTYVRK